MSVLHQASKQHAGFEFTQPQGKCRTDNRIRLRPINSEQLMEAIEAKPQGRDGERRSDLSGDVGTYRTSGYGPRTLQVD